MSLQKPPNTEVWDQVASPGFYQTFKDIITFFSNSFKKTEEEETFQNNFMRPTLS